MSFLFLFNSFSSFRSVQPETWYTFSENNKMVADQVMAESQRLREAIFHSIEQTSNDLRVQQDATNFDFRKRHYEMKRAKEELEYQMKAVGYNCLFLS